MRIPTVPLAVLALTFVAAGCGLFGGGNVFELAVGDCFDDSGGSEEISDVPIVDCADPHDNEVFHVFEVTGDDFPGEAALQAEAQAACLPAFEAYVGASLGASRLDVFPITPTSGSWSAGDREVVCALYDVDLAKLEGSMRATGT